MTSKKVFILSSNNLSTDFWQIHIKLNKSSYWHTKISDKTANDILWVNPDIIIIDLYWPKQDYFTQIQTIVNENHYKNIFCFSPENLDLCKYEYQKDITFSQLSIDVLNTINYMLESTEA